MKSLLVAALSASVIAAGCAPSTPPPVTETHASETQAVARVPYGANAAASGTFEHDGVKFYYETYGQGEPLLLVHGNGASIGSFGPQIEHFKTKYRVIAMDSRGQGKTTEGASPLTYEQMSDDLAALLDHLKAGPANVLGWSDGGIEALLMGIRHPDKVHKLVAMAANLNPSLDAIYPETEAMAKEMDAAIPAEMRNTPEGKKQLKVLNLLLTQPNIDPKSLGQIKAPTLILSGDQDLIRLEHTVAIFNAIPNAELAVFPNNTHVAPYDDAELFNATVERFLATPFKKKDRVKDMLGSFEKLMTEMAH